MGKFEETKKYMSRYLDKMIELSRIADRLATLYAQRGNPYGSGIILHDAGKTTTKEANNPISDYTSKISELELQQSQLFKETSRLERETINIINDAILFKKLPLENEIMINTYIYGLQNKAIAQELDILIKTVEYHKSKALELLEIYLKYKGLIIPLYNDYEKELIRYS